MRVLPSSQQAIDQALVILSQGGVIVHATETCYGLACDLTNPAAVRMLFKIKRRPEDQPVSALFPSIEEAQKYVDWNDRAEGLAQSHLPGPLTLILPRRPAAPPLFTIPPTSYQLPATSSVGLRISSHPLAMELATRFGKPLSTTSANVHGEPAPYSAQEIERQFESSPHKPDLILDSGPLLFAPPSTIVDLAQAAGPQIRRQGNLTMDIAADPRA